jgi:hypothetical protein
MAKKTFTVNAAGVTTGQALDAASTVAKITGDLNGAEVYLEASDTDGSYVTVTGGPLAQDSVTSLALPSGWYVRTRTVLQGDAPSATVTVI